MKLDAWGLSSTKGSSESLLYLSFWLLGAPAILIVFYLLVTNPGGRNDATQYAQAERWIESTPGYSYDTAGFSAMLRSPPDFTKANWATVQLPATQQLPAISKLSGQNEMKRVWLRLHVVPSKVGHYGEKIALYGTRIMGGPYSVWVDDELVESGLDNWRMQWNTPIFVRIPLRFYKTRQPFDVYLAVPFGAKQGYAIGTLYAGPADTISTLFERRQFFQLTLPEAGILVTLLLGVVSFQFWLSRRSETPHLLMALASLSLFIFDLQYFFDFDNAQTASRWFGAIVDVSVSWFVVAWFLFVMRIDNRRYPRVERAMLAYAILVTVLTLPVWGWRLNGLILQHYFDLALMVGSAASVSVMAIRSGSLDLKVMATCMWIFFISGSFDLFLLTSQRWPDDLHTIPYASFYLFGGFQFTLQRRYLKAMDNIEALNVSLDQKLKEREAELDAQHRHMRDIERQQAVFKERQRLMQDMHDGIGSALMTTLKLAEKDRLPPAQVAAVLRDCLDELKLVIDSLEPIAHDLATLLANLRFRLTPRLNAAGIHVHWAMDDLPALDWLEPPQALHVLRILQEALTNVIKHAQASEVRFITKLDDKNPGDQFILIELEDNGRGFTEANNSVGRGLKNMQARAEMLYGSLELSSQLARGTRIRLRLPVVQNSLILL